MNVGMGIFKRFVSLMLQSLLLSRAFFTALLKVTPPILHLPPLPHSSALYESFSNILDALHIHLFIICLLQLEWKLQVARNVVF